MSTSKYPQELRDRATRLACDARRDPASRPGAISRLAEQTGVGKETLCKWVRKAEDAELLVEPVDTAARIRQLESENCELLRSNEILKSAAGFSRRSSTAHGRDRRFPRRAQAPVGDLTTPRNSAVTPT